MARGRGGRKRDFDPIKKGTCCSLSTGAALSLNGLINQGVPPVGGAAQGAANNRPRKPSKDGEEGLPPYEDTPWVTTMPWTDEFGVAHTAAIFKRIVSKACCGSGTLVGLKVNGCIGPDVNQQSVPTSDPFGAPNVVGGSDAGTSDAGIAFVVVRNGDPINNPSGFEIFPSVFNTVYRPDSRLLLHFVGDMAAGEGIYSSFKFAGELGTTRRLKSGDSLAVVAFNSKAEQMPARLRVFVTYFYAQ